MSVEHAMTLLFNAEDRAGLIVVTVLSTDDFPISRGAKAGGADENDHRHGAGG